MDEIDVAQQNDELFRQSALNAHFRRQSAESGALMAAGEVWSKGKLRPGRACLCCDCGEKVETERLKAMPNAVRCIGCQEKKERRDRSLG